MGRAPCCDKSNVKRGPWSPEEDAKLKAYIEQHDGTCGNWIALPQKIGLKRCGKSCRLRWLNYLRPHLKHGSFSEDEDNIICSLYINIGSRWSIIAAQLPGRTDNDIKNYWNTKLKKKLLDKQRKEKQAQASHVFNIKQEIKRETENLVGVTNQITYWPTEHFSFPIPVPNASSIQNYYNLNNQTSSLKDMQTKLDQGLPFSDENQLHDSNMSSQYSSDINYFPQDQLYPASTVSMIAPACCKTNIFPGFGNFPNDVPMQDVSYGMESLGVASGSCMNLTSTASASWGDINSLVYSPLVESRYFGMKTQ